MFINAELEDSIAVDPTDEVRWQRLEEWIVANDPELAPLVELDASVRARRGDVHDLRALRRTLYPRLCGPAMTTWPNYDPFTWRGPFMTAAILILGSDYEKAFAPLSAPAARLVSSVSLHFQRAYAYPPIWERLCSLPCARTLRRVDISSYAARSFERFPRELDITPLAGLSLTHINVRRVHFSLRGVESVKSLRRLGVAIARDGELVRFLAGRLPGLRALTLGLRAFRRERGAARIIPLLAPLLRGHFAPGITELELSCDGAANTEVVLRALRTSAILPRLREVDLGGSDVPPASVEGFAHLDRLRLGRPGACVP